MASFVCFTDIFLVYHRRRYLVLVAHVPKGYLAKKWVQVTAMPTAVLAY